MLKILVLAVMVATIAVPAHAGPVAAAVAWVGATLKAGGIAAALLRTAIGLGASLLSSANAKATAQKPKVDVRFEMQFGDDTPLDIIVGDYATAGKLKYLASWGKNTRFVTEVIEVSALPQPGLQAIWVGDEKGVWANDKRWAINPANEPVGSVSDQIEFDTVPSGWLDVGRPLSNLSDDGNRIYVKWVDGTQTAADPFLVWAFGGDPDYPWTADMIGTGKSYAIVTTRYDDDTLTSKPSWLFQPQPLPMYDPRKDSTAGGSGAHRWGNRSTYEPTRNPAVIAYNIARGIYFGSEWIFGGRNLPVWRLPLAEWFAAMNACDATVPLAGGGTEPAYRCGLQISADMTPADVLEEIGRAANMRFAEVGGMLKPIVGLPGSAAFAFSDDSILITEGQSYKPFNALSETFNALSATYPEPDEKWSTKDAPEYVDADATAADEGRYLPTSIAYPAAPYRHQVQRLMRAQMRDYRRMRLHQFSLPPDAYALEPGVDMVSWTSERNGYINKQFVVEEVVKAPGMNVLVTLREVDPGDYDWSSDFEMPVTIVTPVTPGVFVQTISGLSVQAVVVQNSAGDRKRPAIRVSCDGDETGVSQIHIQARVAGTSDITTETTQPFLSPWTWYLLDVVPDTTYEVRARLLSDLTPKSDWSVWYEVTTADVGGELSEEIYEQLIEEMTETAYRAGVTPVTSLPATGEPNQIVMLIPDGILYRWDPVAGEWTTNIYAGIPDGAIDETKFAQGIEPVTIIDDADPLPTTKRTEVIYWQGDTYRWDPVTGAYTKAIKAPDIDGQLIAAQIADAAVTPDKLATVPGHNLMRDPAFAIVSEWPDASSAWTHSPGKWTVNALGSSGQTFIGSKPINIVAGLRYRLSFTVQNITAANSECRLQLIWLQPDGVTQISVSQTGWPVISGTAASVQSLEADAPAGAAFVRANIRFRNRTDGGTVEVTAPELIHINSSSTIADAAITTAKIVNAAIDSAKLADGAATAAKIAANAITSVKIADAAVLAAKIADGAVTAQKILDGAVTSAKIVDAAINSAKLADGAATAAKIATGAITETKISDGAISTPKLAAGAVTAGTIAAGAIQAGHVAAGAIETGHIAAGAITAGKIAAQAVGADQIAANVITASKLAIGDFSNLILNPELATGDGWDFTNGATPVTGPDRPSGASAPGNISIPAITSGEALARWGVASQRFPGREGDQYYAEAHFRASGAADRYFRPRIVVWQYDAAGTYIGALVPVAGPPITDTAYTLRGGSFTLGAGVASFAIGFGRTGTAAEMHVGYVENPVLRRRVAGELVVDGAITTDKLAANAVEADNIAANAVTAGKILAGAIQTAHIAAGAVQAGNIAAGAVEAAKIAAGAITTDKLAALSVTTAKLAVGAVDADRIAANAVTAGKILAGAVETDKLAANAVTSAKILAGAVTTAKLAAGAVEANNIAAGAITSDKIAANAITAGKIAAGAIGADQIAAGAIIASKLMVSDFSNLIVNNWTGGSFDGWGTSGSVSIQNRTDTVFVDAGIAGNMAVVVGGDAWLRSPLSTVSAGEQYYCEVWFRRSGVDTPDGFAYVQIRWTLNDGSAGYTAVGSTSSGAVTKVSGIVTVPANAVDASVWIRPNANGTTGSVFVARPVLRRAGSGELIVDGAITANKIMAGAITSDKIAASAIVTSKLAAGAVTADKITVSSLSAISANLGSILVGSANIADGAITNAKIASAAITEAKIASAAITNAKIANLSVNTIKIADGAVTAQFVAEAASAVVNSGNMTSYLTLNFSLSQASTILFGWSYVLTIPEASSGGVESYVYLDGAQIPISRVALLRGTSEGGVISADPHRVLSVSLAAGNHTLQIRAAITSGTQKALNDMSLFVWRAYK